MSPRVDPGECEGSERMYLQMFASLVRVVKVLYSTYMQRMMLLAI
jgi:hypothetical protein